MKWLAANWFKMALLLITAFGFYWYSWRPYSAAKYCSAHAAAVNGIGDGKVDGDGYDWTFKACMRRRGF